MMEICTREKGLPQRHRDCRNGTGRTATAACAQERGVPQQHWDYRRGRLKEQAEAAAPTPGLDPTDPADAKAEQPLLELWTLREQKGKSAFGEVRTASSKSVDDRRPTRAVKIIQKKKGERVKGRPLSEEERAAARETGHVR